jgi:hypothetical protein
MASKISFIIQLKDQFGKVAAKVNRQFEGMKRKADKANRSITELVKKGQRGLGNLGKKAAKTGAIMTASLTVPIALLGRAMINAASDATETANKFDAVFDDVRGKANLVADDFARSFGVAGSTARKMIGDTGDLLVGFGFTGDAALEMSKKVSELASDLASFQNFAGGAEGANLALTKAILGESESAKALGIVVRQGTKEFKTNIKQIMRSQRVNLLQAKAIEILRIATTQSRKAVGDVNRTWEDYASVQRRSTERTKELKESFGRLLIPIATKVTNIMIKVVDAIGRLSPGMKKTVLILAGLVAIGGPLLVVLGGIALAFSVISLPILAIGAAILGVTAIITAAVLNWQKITDVFNGIWESAKAGLIDFVNFGILAINSLLAPLNFVAEKLGFGSVSISQVQAPSAPGGGANGTLNGQITVMAEPGTRVRRTSIQARGRGMNIGMNMAAT